MTGRHRTAGLNVVALTIGAVFVGLGGGIGIGHSLPTGSATMVSPAASPRPAPAVTVTVPGPGAVSTPALTDNQRSYLATLAKDGVALGPGQSLPLSTGICTRLGQHHTKIELAGQVGSLYPDLSSAQASDVVETAQMCFCSMGMG